MVVIILFTNPLADLGGGTSLKIQLREKGSCNIELQGEGVAVKLNYGGGGG